jgi:hypothetical protein
MAERLAVVALLALALVQAACVTRTVRESVFDQEGIEILLRSQKKGGEPIDKGFQHPLTIAPVRMVHVLSRIDLRDDSDKMPVRRPAIPTDKLYTIAGGVSRALAQADPSQEVVVQVVRRTKRFGVFDRYYLTSFLCYARDELLFVQVSRSDWEIPVRRRNKLPETHVGEHPLDFALVSDEAMTLADSQTLAIEWRNAIFKRPTRTRLTAGGKVVRRTILMEMEEDPTEFEPAPTLGELSPEALRELADLEEARRRGEINETEYTIRKREILEGETGGK